MSQSMEFDLDALRERGAITPSDVLELRRAFFEDGVLSRAEAEALIALEGMDGEKDPSWTAFYLEALTDYLVHQAVPHGYVTAENADWLTARIARNGVVRGKADLELVIHVLDAARWAPSSLSAFALDQVRHAVIHGAPARPYAAHEEAEAETEAQTGAEAEAETEVDAEAEAQTDGAGSGERGPDIRAETPSGAGVVTAEDVAMLRRVLYAFGGDGNIAITMAEAEVLFAIDEATAGADNHPDWPALFVQAIGNAVMAASGYSVPSRREALRREAWLAERGGVGGFLANMVSGGLSAVRDAYREQSAEERALARLEAQRQQIITAETITAGEAYWLADHIGRDGRLSDNEQALLAFIRQESPNIHPALAPLLDEVSPIQPAH